MLTRGKNFFILAIFLVVFGFYFGIQFLQVNMSLRDRGPIIDPEEARYLKKPGLITITTMYLNLGSFEKGSKRKFYTTKGYKKWMGAWGWMENPVVAYFDDGDIMNEFINIRKLQPAFLTKVFKVERSQLLAFKDFDKVKTIFSNPKYPKHYPNTVYPQYSCAVSAKFDALDMTMKANLVKTKYLAWLDVGYFRNLVGRNETYQLIKPNSFDEKKIALTQVKFKADIMDLSPENVILKNKNWLASGMILATPKVHKVFIARYRAARQELLKKNLTNTAQQIIAALYTEKMKTKPAVEVQPYDCRFRTNPKAGPGYMWFCLGFDCKMSAEGKDL